MGIKNYSKSTSTGIIMMKMNSYERNKNTYDISGHDIIHDLGNSCWAKKYDET